MKEIKEEIIKKEYSIKYEAIDGTIFNDAQECKKYEESAKMVLYAKYKPLIIAHCSEEELFGVGSEEYTFDTIKLQKEEDIDLIIQLYILFRNGTASPEIINGIKKDLTKYYNTNDIVLIGRGCAYDNYDNFYIGDSLNTRIASITAVANGNSER